MKSSGFTYRSFSQADQIRILILDPAKQSNEPVISSLRFTGLKNPDKYEALSYSWSERADGIVEFDKKIQCDGEEIAISSSAFNAICNLRLPDQPRALWIDAICIDQGNATERAQQVSMMADVYAAASSVIIWLGLESVDQDGYHAITTMKGAAQSRHRDYPFKREMSHLWERQDLDMGTRISRYLRYCWILGRHVDGETLEIASTEFERFDAVFNASQGPGSQQTTLAPSQLGASEASGSNCWLYTLLCRFFDRRWFTRRWVLQETRHARHIVWTCGTSDFETDHLENALSIITNMIEATRGDNGRHWDVSAMQRARHIMDLRNRRMSYQEPLDVLYRYQEFNCSDARDKIYALLSLMKEELVRPDYTPKTGMVYFQAACACIKNNHLGKLLWQAALRQPRPDDLSGETLPSWVPDWRVDVNRSRDTWPTDSEARYTFGYRHHIRSYTINADKSLTVNACRESFSTMRPNQVPVLPQISRA